MLGKPFLNRHDTIKPCWLFCQSAYKDKGLLLDADPSKLVGVKEPRLMDIALFQMGSDWHAGVVWPDGLHFVHAYPHHGNPNELCYLVGVDRLTIFPWKSLLRGYYR